MKFVNEKYSYLLLWLCVLIHSSCVVSLRIVNDVQLQYINNNNNDTKVNYNSNSNTNNNTSDYVSGNVAYFFDFLDSSLQAPIIKEFQKVYKKALKLNGKKYNKHNNSTNNNNITASDLKVILSKWGWHNPYANEEILLKTFSKTKGNTLTMEEFITLSVSINTCSCVKYCYKDIYHDLIDPLFKLIDESGDEYATAEEIFNSLKKLGRKEPNKYNIYNCVTASTNIVKFYHTESLNEFVLKNMKQREGMVSLDEFRKGIMFGYINRHIKGNKVFIGDTINNKESRWSEDGMKDLMCEKIKKYEDDAIKNAIRNDSVHNANNVYRHKKVKETETPGVSVDQVMLPDKERCNNKSNEQLKGKKHKKKQQVHLDNNNNNSIHDTINNVQNKTKEIVSDISNAIDTGASIVKDVTSGIGFIKGKVNKYKKDKDK